MWDWNYAFEILPELLVALRMTVVATLLGFLTAVIGGLLLAFAIRSRYAWLRLAAKGFNGFIRNTPLLVQVFFLYYSLPILASISLPAFYAGILGLGLHYSTYLSEVYRSGIDAVPRGQWEAAVALNYSKADTWRSVILPQAIPPIIPVLGNYLIVMFKETPILSAITMVELLLTAKNIVSESFRVFEPYTLVGVLFLAISYPSSLLIRRLELRMNLQRGK
ncbi:ectoine/hydroxyectoine ABC transporter permease subunit EhuD [Paenibacillus timonensis]|uniref:ectoine/hydroxyectoine ABC transporter permease subunit EhuD n=1 Tax=Paenibacillus TaxID=44249 RepID=UPI0012D9EACA|nr:MULTISPECIES: ectoine/hydroxyectoine ABC transporter permease subunit EhuD [Paenibacillus]MUG88507.1 ectoine/hydroxyectoine ABC transporter permease subunit EhuD [Paenibacillus timonensis]GIP46415.1 ectoine/hydroxyectoine ABC transporter permease subunit EhuD [Paenibacillus sp. J53TS2]